MNRIIFTQSNTRLLFQYSKYSLYELEIRSWNPKEFVSWGKFVVQCLPKHYFKPLCCLLLFEVIIITHLVRSRTKHNFKLFTLERKQKYLFNCVWHSNYFIFHFINGRWRCMMIWANNLLLFVNDDDTVLNEIACCCYYIRLHTLNIPLKNEISWNNCRAKCRQYSNAKLRINTCIYLLNSDSSYFH